MPTTAVETVVVDREAIIDALSHFEAALEVIAELNGNIDCDMATPLLEAQTSLWQAALGESSFPDEDEPYERDPVRVEVLARGATIAADLLDRALNEPAPIVFADPEIARGIPERIRVLRASAEGIRESGTIAGWRSDA